MEPGEVLPGPLECDGRSSFPRALWSPEWSPPVWRALAPELDLGIRPGAPVTSAGALPLELLQELGLICRSGVGAAQVHLASWLGQTGGMVCEARGFYGRTL